MTEHLEIANTLARAFDLPGQPLEVTLLKGGHINVTLLAHHDAGAFVHQRLNPYVFPDLPALSDNVARICERLEARWGAQRTLRVRRTGDRTPYFVDAHDHWWRTTDYIPDARVPDPGRLEEVALSARAFGEFASALADLDPAPADTIKRFHDLPRRLEALEAATRENAAGRRAHVQAELERARALADDVLALLAAVGLERLPQRVVHNDAKLANVLLNHAGAIVVDLDTVMVGPLLNDVGELLRTAAHTSEEDEPDASTVRVDAERYAAVIEGFAAGTGDLLTGAERDSFKAAGPYLALENGVRFLADHLQGDKYFRVSREGHNLDRARVQLEVTAQLLRFA